MALALHGPHWACRKVSACPGSAALVTAIAYAVTGWLASFFALLPFEASPLYPATGVALACVLVYGPRVLPAVALGSITADLLLLAQRGPLDPAALGLAAVFALGAALQAWLGASLVQRTIRGPFTLSEPSQVLRFVAAGLVSSSIGAGVFTLVLDLSASVLPAALPLSVATWWLGSLFGVLVAAPAVLTLIGTPAEAWAPRRRSVGLTLALVAFIVSTGIGMVLRWNGERTRAAFESDAQSASLALAERLQDRLQALEALRAVLTVLREPTQGEVQTAAANWLGAGGLQAMGWSERLQKAESNIDEPHSRPDPARRLSFSTELTTLGPGGAFDAGAGTFAGSAGYADVMAVRFIEPASVGPAAFGMGALSASAAQEAIETTRLSGKPAATAGFRLGSTDTADPSASGVVVFQAVYSGVPMTPARRVAALRGAAFVVLGLDAELKRLAPQLAPYLKICIVDRERRVAGPAGCETEAAPLSHVQPLTFAGRPWELRISARAEDLPAPFNGSAWLFSLSGVLAAAVIAAFLLTVTGRTQRIEVAVRQRTAALEAEVGEREIAEAALRDSEQRFRNILDNVPIGVIYTNLAGDVIQANPRFCELTGYAEDELLSLSLLDFTHSDDAAQELAMAEQLVLGEIPMYRRNKRYITKAGLTVWVQSTVSLLRDSQNQPWRIVGVVEDITEDLRLEQAEHARETAEAANRAKSEFLSRMSHELRTPLNAMLGFAQLLELDPRNPLTEAQRPWVVQIQQAGWHLLEMINDVLDLSRIESGNLRLQTDTLRLPDLLEATVAMVTADAQARGIAITQDMAPGTAGVLGDATRIKQILTNLLSNAVKYNADGGRIHIASRLGAAETVELAVTDTGLGMTAQQMAELFQPFNRLGRERSSAHQGTGIGLVISQRLAELMGGSLRARSVAGQGSSFILTLPRVSELDRVPSDHGALDPVPTEYHRRVVHYVEDNETNVEVMRGILAQRSQVHMQVSITGLDALAAVRAQHPDLILLDMHLPDISGLDLLRHLKKDRHTAHVPIVVVSADALAKQISDALEAGADRYLTKPVSVTELLGVLDELLGRAQTGFH